MGMNYYYEFPESISVFSRPGGGYYVLRDQTPSHLAESAFKHATRVWEENTDGVRLIKRNGKSLKYNEQEFLIVKLSARDLI
jgi:hypothetical protein